MERIVVLIKPDGMKKGLVGEVISRFEKGGFKLLAVKMVKMNQKLLETWYAHHKDKPFFPSIVDFMRETPVVATLWQGENIIFRSRELTGPTDSKRASGGTIRGDFGEDIQRNIIHVSDSPEAAKKEEELMFSPKEIFEY
ncbi:MAG: nucleoside-diphosphate kinase [Candidatus Curtissbacteria bacterium]|nr:nucleoside-diphosphate kinase [bacterium]MDZ4209907.1 nucleoside-diphosphate kinase [Candidatus Curtissbacteria bacterium]